MGEQCPCKGKKSTSWHYIHKIPTCDAANAARTIQRHGTPRPPKPRTMAREYNTWIPGTPILVPEIDPL